MLRVLGVVVAAAMLAVLAACSSGSGYSDLDREATSADVLPTDLPASAMQDVVEDSVRFVGEHDGARYYLAAWTEVPGACVVGYRSAEEWIGGCGGAGAVILAGAGFTVVIAPDGSPDLDEGTPVSANVTVR
jgi:hypothetical protein